jgi:hypothetical protein
MIDSFPWQKWNDKVTTFWTFGPGGGHSLTGTYVLTGLGMLLMIAALVYWVWLEDRKLAAQATALRASGAVPLPGEGQPGVATGPTEPPFAGPSTERD